MQKQPPEVFYEKRPACNFIKKETLAQVFSCEFCEISKNAFLQNTSGRLLVEMKLKDIPLTIPGDRAIPAITYSEDRAIPAITYPAPCYCHVVGLVLIYLTQYFLF